MTKASKGTPLTDDVLDRLADEAEAGYAPHQLRVREGPGRPRLSEGDGPSASLNIRIEDELRERLAERAARERPSASGAGVETARRWPWTVARAIPPLNRPA